MLHVFLLGALACPNGDTPASFESFSETEATLSLRVDDDGVGRLFMRLAFENTSEGPATTAVSLSVPGERPPVVTRVALRGSAAAALVDAEPARDVWQAFKNALSMGVPDEQVRAGVRRAGVHVMTNAQGDDAPLLELAAACSVRAPVVDIELLLDGETTPSGHRFTVSPVFTRATLEVSAGTRGVVIDGHRTRAATRTALDTLVTTADEMRAFVVEVERPRALVARAQLVPLVPHAAARAPESADESVSPDDDTPAPRDPFTIAHVALDLPDPLVETPRDLRLVFVVDTSVSVGEAGVARALDLVAAILEASPDDVGFAVVTAARHPTLLVPPWRHKSDRTLPMPLVENGSNVDAAVQKALRIASDATKGSGRVIVLTDLHLRAGGEAALARAVLAPLKNARVSSSHAPLLHTVVLPRGLDDDTRGLEWTRDTRDNDVLVSAVTQTGGIVVTTMPGDGGLAPLAQHLTRPTSLDGLTVRFDGVDVEETEDLRALLVRTGNDAESDGILPEVLPAGAGLRASFVIDGRVKKMSLSGDLWGTRVDIPVHSSSRARALALAEAVNIDLKDELHDDEVRAAAYAGHFASRTTSFLDVPSWRPAEPDTLRLHGCGCSGFGSCGSGCFGTTTRCGGSSIITVTAAQAVLDALALRVAKVCGVSRIDSEIEIRDHEILDVTDETAGPCVRDAFFRARLDRGERHAAFDLHRTWKVRIPRDESNAVVAADIVSLDDIAPSPAAP